MTETKPEKGGPADSAVSGTRQHQDEVEYRDALARLAREAGMPACQFEETMLAELGNARFGPDCIRFDEIEQWGPKDLPRDRQQHVRNCDECRQFLLAIVPIAGEAERFAQRAVNGSGRQRRRT